MEWFKKELTAAATPLAAAMAAAWSSRSVGNWFMMVGSSLDSTRSICSIILPRQLRAQRHRETERYRNIERNKEIDIDKERV